MTEKKIEKAKKKNSRGIIISYHPRKIQRKNRIKYPSVRSSSNKTEKKERKKEHYNLYKVSYWKRKTTAKIFSLHTSSKSSVQLKKR